MPLRNTNMMPARHARSGKRGLPPLGFAFGVGMKDSMISHNLSGKSAVGMGKPPTYEHIPGRLRVSEERAVLLEALKEVDFDKVCPIRKREILVPGGGVEPPRGVNLGG